MYPGSCFWPGKNICRHFDTVESFSKVAIRNTIQQFARTPALQFVGCYYLLGAPLARCWPLIPVTGSPTCMFEKQLG
jgi:hypothetical protein